MPCFLVNIAGPTFTLKNNEKMMSLFSRAFHALRLSLQELDKYYRNVPQIYYRQYPLFLDLTLTSQSEEVTSPQLLKLELISNMVVICFEILHFKQITKYKNFQYM
ncbi:unnamed protein product [Rhizophagus irregularis]|uniref:Uncharacterized protein n=1 Tax=Rhizophagus irregularis TaxID=588596 RepID=A0A915YRJ8_9GLOM|nr:unnamed protein product [Rhizophagus irregularis]CAB5199915.1 unnamed protein product [Rhizophagus irregularis]CAB5322112.1 unnamed protein product [Rhizophagus irregularis]